MEPHGRTSSAATVTVLGGSRLLVELVTTSLRAAAIEPAPLGAPGSVVILIEPTPADWASAERYSRPCVVVTLDPLPPDRVVATLLEGANAVLSAQDAPADIVGAVEAVAAGNTWLRPEHTAALLDFIRSSGTTEGVIGLTDRERDVLASIERGDTVRQTAQRLGIAPKTVENVQLRLYKKLRARSKAQAVARAHALGISGRPD